MSSQAQGKKNKPTINDRTRRVRDAITGGASAEQSIHPGLIPGIGVEKTGVSFPTNLPVFVVALLASIAVLVWAISAPENLNATGVAMQTWVAANFGWFFTGVVALVGIFMLVLAMAPTGNIRLGADDEDPTFSRASWISMLFAAGLGIGLIFYGPLEPLSHFITVPPAFGGVGAESSAAMLPALSQAVLHQAFVPWALYALVGGALAYATYRRGRLPLISALFEPVFPGGTHRLLGRIIDIFAVMVTLFGTATSMGIGALQIQMGTEIVTGWGTAGNAFLISAVCLLTALFVISAVTGVKKGIRMLSNANMFLVILLAVFALIAGPTVYLLDFMPSTLMSFVNNLGDMMSVNASQGPEQQEFMIAWTTMYWAWWLSWSPFVGMFIAKISRGRTIREFVFVVIFVPSLISVAWYSIFGGNAMHQRLDGDLEIHGSGENVMFDVLGNLPLGGIMAGVALVAVVIFFITAADSATVVMGSMSQTGRPVPSRPVTIVWGVALGMISLFLLLAGGENALSGLQSIMVTCALPFAVILLGVLWCWVQDLRTDPYMIRRHYARKAIAKGVRRGIDEYGDDFVFGSEEVPAEEGAGADFESEDPALTEWYTAHEDADETPATDAEPSGERPS